MTDHLESDIRNLERELASLTKSVEALERRIVNIERSAGGSIYEFERRMGVIDQLERRMKALETNIETVKKESKDGQSMDFGVR
ncbi:MAG: hypothetical protein RL681_6 [Candidatus Parcubacteria bacterium]|jgi:exonuclease VII small subunit